MNKLVSRSNAFLWRKNEMNPVLANIIKARQNSDLVQVTKEDAMKLYDDSLVDSDLLYNDLVIVDKIEGDWAKVVVPSQHSFLDKRGYPGWMLLEDLVDTDKTTEQDEKLAVVVPKTQITYENGATREVSFGTLFSKIAEEDDNYRITTPHGQATISRAHVALQNEPRANIGVDVVQMALQFLDLPYVWAGISSAGFDCSGFAFTLYRTCGKYIGRDATEQSFAGEKIAYADAEPGDLLFFAYEEGKGEVHHVGVYIGNDEMVHSQTPGSKVILTKITGSKYEPELCVTSRHR
ncbi:C40 family peptidase [Listeria seeligeri]|uniref:C40 family peptidase n=1 Tax=Listeria seeligeri TaxID=1640 RepID=UPI00162A4F86|nr:NlpC/P60 family protein [Listeria seeligeri]MBC1832989.1 C40 family peptidase [Listeria seeligeri]MBC1868871.1 C40 family peptidase [Listeria seeligeri]MBC1875712.1 C40 family peptidase [Listeria seeligeri]MBC1899880.1 C40 family peptidase [Listeria seeligeri]MBC2093273.1 C40 family peptidase [Listeria seeligeri]